ncbi:MAG: hypothetical protein ACFFAN_05960 [Promethearchaeota archaeon]
MAQRNPALWQTEPIENFLSHHHLFRGINRNIWQYWGDDISDIQENFITFPRKSETTPELSVDWNKYCQDPKDTLMRLFLTSYSKKHNSSINLTIQDLGISLSSSIYGLSIEDLTISNDIVFMARKKNGIIRFKISELMRLIEKEELPITLRHDPIKYTNQINPFLNRAHSIIEGFTRINYTKIRALLRDIVKWCNGFEPIIE